MRVQITMALEHENHAIGSNGRMWDAPQKKQCPTQVASTDNRRMAGMDSGSDVVHLLSSSISADGRAVMNRQDLPTDNR